MRRFNSISHDVLEYKLLPYLPLRELYYIRDLPEAKEIYQARLNSDLTTEQGAGEVIKLALTELNSKLFNYAYDRLYRL